MNAVDQIVRDVSEADARERFEPLWAEVRRTLDAKRDVRRTLYFDVLRVTGRFILSRLEERGDFNEEVWQSYCQFMGHSILSFGTADVPNVLNLWGNISSAVKAFPATPRPLLEDYQRCTSRQQTQYEEGVASMRSTHAVAAAAVAQIVARQAERERRVAALGATRSPSTNSPLKAFNDPNFNTIPASPPTDVPAPSPPDLEYDNKLNAVVPRLTSEEMLTALNDMPARMSFAHKNGILHMKLTNPLHIPPCGFVTSGYSCDTCMLRGLHVAYQAMLYDSDEGDGGGLSATAGPAHEHDHGEGSTAQAHAATPALATAPAALGRATDADSSGHSGVSSHEPPRHVGAATTSVGTRAAADVRNDAQISRTHLHGFDVCLACAVHFHRVQRENYRLCMAAPHPPLVLGHASGVQILSASVKVTVAILRGSAHGTPTMPRTPVRTTSSHSDSRSSRSQSSAPPQRRMSLPVTSAPSSEDGAGARWTVSHSPAPSHAGTSIPPPPPRPPRSHFAAGTTGGVEAGTMLYTRRRSSGSDASSVASSIGAPHPPRWRAVAANTTTVLQPSCVGHKATTAVAINASIAPWGARPIAWVLQREVQAAAEAAAPSAAPESSLWPPKDWRARCRFACETAYRQGTAKECGHTPENSHISAVGPHTASGSGNSSTGTSTPYSVSISHASSERGAHAGTVAGSGPLTPFATARNGSNKHSRGPSSPLSSLPLRLSSSPDTSIAFGSAENSISFEILDSGSRVSERKSLSSASSSSVDLCTICLNPLAGELPVMQTKCGHFFHVECLEGHVRMIGDVCPLCRHHGAMPDITRESTLQQNRYCITVELTEQEASRDEVTVCVGALISRNGTFENVTSVAALTCVTLSLKTDSPPAAKVHSTQPALQPPRAADKDPRLKAVKEGSFRHAAMGIVRDSLSRSAGAQAKSEASTEHHSHDGSH